YIQEVSNKKNTYGLFIYSNMNKIQFAFYDPKIGIKEFNYNEYSKFKNQFSKLISNYGKNYTSFRLKIDSSTKKITPKNIMNLEGLLTLLSQSSNNYIDYINNSKCFILIGSKKEDYNFCKSILASQKTDLSHESIGNEFFIKYTNYIHKVRKNPNDLQEKSFWIFYLINYLAYNTELARAELNTLEPFLGKEKIFDIVIDYFNQKNNSLKWNTKKVISLILIEVYKNMSTYDFRIPFYYDTKQFKLNHTQNKIGKFLLESFDLDPKTTITDWNRQGFVYNDRFISKRFDGTYETFIGYNDINKDMSLKEYQNNVSNEILEKHFLKSTENKDIKFAKLCLGVCNQTHVFGIGNLLTAYFNEKYSEIINFKYKYIFIKKICENIYDFMILYYIEDITLPKKEITQKFKSPIYFNYTFSIEIKDQDYIAKNFNMGFLNKTLENNSSNNFKQKILAAMQDDMIIQFYKKSKKNVISYIYMS
ncbi:MAG: hypothetical protein K2X69_10810, partial [Silvanigrellaceae bacterium]|nr:hypothetical protein [Silvanigrellaceae bacterium]